MYHPTREQIVDIYISKLSTPAGLRVILMLYNRIIGSDIKDQLL